MPKVSIVTTTYKHERFIASTIESILSQSFTDWELLIGDDNSPDSTYQIIQEYAKKDTRIQIWKQPKNIGIVGNMNFLLQRVSPESEYITFLEGDDMYTPDNLDTKVAVFMNHPKVDFFWSDWHQIDAMGVVSSRKTNRKEGLYIYSLLDLLRLGNPIQSFGVVAFRHTLLRKILPIESPDGKQVGMFGPLDYLLWTKIVPDLCMYFSEKPIFHYRIHGDNFVRQVSTMNTQIEMIYSKIIQQESDPYIKEICHQFIWSNRVVSAFFAHQRISVWTSGINRLTYGWDMRTIMLMLVSFLPWRLVDRCIIFYRSHA